MVLNNLRKTVEYYKQQLCRTTDAGTQKLELLRGLPFYCVWIPNPTTNNTPGLKNGLCCWNHVIGLPKKDGHEYPLFDYELQLFNALTSHEYIWVKKASGLGITEFVLRFMAWLATRDDTYRNSQFLIVCGPNQDIAIKLIKRIKLLFESLGLHFATKETVIELNGCHIEAFPCEVLSIQCTCVSKGQSLYLGRTDFDDLYNLASRISSCIAISGIIKPDMVK